MAKKLPDYRKPKHRWTGFDRYFEYEYKTNDAAPDVVVEAWLSDELDFDFEQRCVLALFHGAVYSGATETIFAVHFPKFDTNANPIIDFYRKNHERLPFSRDCKYRRMVFDQFLNSIAQSVKKYGSLGQLVASCFDSDDKKANYTQLQRLCFDEWYHWGRMGHWCFAEALYNIIKAPIDPPTMEFFKGSSHRKGWAFCLNRDDLAGKRISKENSDFLELKAAKYIASLHHPNANFFTLETACCNYKRQHTGSRYGGSYIDLQYDDIQWARKKWSELDYVWDAYMRGRRAVLPASLLYESETFKGQEASEYAYIKSWNKALRDYGRIPRVEAWFEGKPQVWTELENLPFAAR